MMNVIPLEKRSKKEQRTYHAKQRGSWNGVNPVTKVVPSKKIYSRKGKQAKHWNNSPGASPVFCVCVFCFGMLPV